MPNITFNDQVYPNLTHESVLDSLLKHDVSVNHACKNGVCQSCMMQTKTGTIPAKAQQGLKTTQIAQNYFLACVCYPEEDIEIQSIDSVTLTYTATIIETQLLSPSIKRLRLDCPDMITYKAGQFINLYHPDGQVRSYSLASLPSDGYLELHVKKVDSGVVSVWIHDQLAVGDQVSISDAMGNCFYTDQDPQQPVLMIGTGTGLAPLIGIMRDALSQGHQGDIYLYHGSHALNGLYYIDQLQALAQQFPNVHYIACISGDDDVRDPFYHGRSSTIALSNHPNLSGWRIFLCGNADMVKDTKRRAFLAKASMKDIFVDAF